MRKLVCVVFLFAFAPSAMAAMVTYNYTGTGTAATGIFAGQGTSVTGTFSFDDRLVDAEPFNATIDAFVSSSPPANLPLAPALSATLNLGSVSLSQGAPLGVEADVAALNNAVGNCGLMPCDIVEFVIHHTGSSTIQFNLQAV